MVQNWKQEDYVKYLDNSLFASAVIISLRQQARASYFQMSLNFAEVTFEDSIVGEHLTSYIKQSWILLDTGLDRYSGQVGGAGRGVNHH